MLKVMNKISNALNTLCKVLAVLSISVLILVMLAQILKRGFMDKAITWADGVARYMLIWSTFLGAAIATKENGHISLTFIQDKLRGNARKIYDSVLVLLFIALSVAVVYAGIQIVDLVIPQKSDSLPISVAWIYVSIPFCESVIVFHLITDFLNRLFDICTDKKEKGGGEN